MTSATKPRRVAPNALVASAQVLTGVRTQDPALQRKPWQDEAWMFYDSTGPLRYAANWLANLMSRARLQAASLTPGGDEPVPIDSGPAAEAIEGLAGGVNGQSQMLRSCAVDLTVPGVGYLVGRGTDYPTWRMYSADVLRMHHPATASQDAEYQLQVQDGASWETLEPDSLVVKIWRPHERYYWEPDSPARAALGDLRELHRIRQYIDATLVSRLAGAGIVIIPQEATFPTAPNQPDGTHPFVAELMEVMMSAVKKPGTAAQVVPFPVVLPAQYAEAFRHVRFETEVSEHILEMRESALRQCAITLDVPAEVLTGMADANHWTAWALEESAVKVHAEPLLEVITAALTKGFLHPVLRAGGMPPEEVETFVVWADTSELSSKPDKSDDALALLDRGDLSPGAALRETGLSDADSPTDEEFERWAWKQLLKSDTMAPIALEALGIKVPESALPPPPPVPPVNSNGDAPPEFEEPEGEETEGPPEETDREGLSLSTVIALEGFVFRALERAGNRLRNHSSDSVDCVAHQVHVNLGGSLSVENNTVGLLRDAWVRLPDVAQELGLNPAHTVSCLNTHCTMLLEQGLEYNREDFAKALQWMRRVVVA